VRQLRQPVQVIYGDQDGPALPDVASKSALFFAENRAVHFDLVANCGHWLAFEQPGIFHDLLNAWVRDCSLG
jgi:pimeloyl-ACP methyl ester carboxylesterase